MFKSLFLPRSLGVPLDTLSSTFHDINLLYYSECDFIEYSLNLKAFLFISLSHTCLLSKFCNLLEDHDFFAIVLHLQIHWEGTNIQSNLVSFFSPLIIDSSFL